MKHADNLLLLCQPLGVSLGQIGVIPNPLVARGCAKTLTLESLLCQPLGVSLGRIGAVPPNLSVVRRYAKTLTLERLLCRPLGLSLSQDGADVVSTLHAMLLLFSR